MAQIGSDCGFWYFGKNKTCEPELVCTDPTESIPRKPLISRIHSPTLPCHTIFEVLRPVTVREVVPMV